MGFGMFFFIILLMILVLCSVKIEDFVVVFGLINFVCMVVGVFGMFIVISVWINGGS